MCVNVATWQAMLLYKTFGCVCVCACVFEYTICIVIWFICVPPVPMTIFKAILYQSFNGNSNNSTKYVYFIVLYSAWNTICL